MKASNEKPSGFGKKLLIDFLQDNRKNKSTARNKSHIKKILEL